MTISGLCRSSTCRSCASRALERCTIRFGQIGADRLPLCVGMSAQPVFDVAEPGIELFGAAAIHRRKRADHAVAAGRHHEIDAGDQEHRRCDQRQAEAVAKAREWIGGIQRSVSLIPTAFAVSCSEFAVLALDNIGTIEAETTKPLEETCPIRSTRFRRLRADAAGAGALSVADGVRLAGRIDHLCRRHRTDRAHAEGVHATRPEAGRARRRSSPPTAPTPGAPASPRNCRGSRSPGCIRWGRSTISCSRSRIPTPRCW